MLSGFLPDAGQYKLSSITYGIEKNKKQCGRRKKFVLARKKQHPLIRKK